MLAKPKHPSAMARTAENSDRKTSDDRGHSNFGRAYFMQFFALRTATVASGIDF